MHVGWGGLMQTDKYNQSTQVPFTWFSQGTVWVQQWYSRAVGVKFSNNYEDLNYIWHKQHQSPRRNLSFHLVVQWRWIIQTGGVDLLWIWTLPWHCLFFLWLHAFKQTSQTLYSSLVVLVPYCRQIVPKLQLLVFFFTSHNKYVSLQWWFI